MATALQSFRRSLIGRKISTSKSDRSESVYIDHGPLHIRVSRHHLGRKDYGSVEQVHRGGPDIVLDSTYTTKEEIAYRVLCEVRDESDYRAWRWSAGERTKIAQLMRTLRKMI